MPPAARNQNATGEQGFRVVTVYVVDDHDLVRAQLVDLLDRAPGLRVVGSSGEAATAITEIVRLKPSVTVLDGYLRDTDDGLDVCRELRLTAPNVAVVILTSGVSVSWGPAEAAAAGAAAFMLKRLLDFPLVDVVHRVASGERLLRPGSPDTTPKGKGGTASEWR